MSRAIGIDLGTTNSCAAVFSNGRAVVIPSPEGANTTPSVVAYLPTGNRLVGILAKRQAITNPSHTFSSVKRLIGRKFDTPEVGQATGYLSFALAAAPNGDAAISLEGRILSIPEVQAEILQHLRITAETHLGESITEAVITVPAYFNDAQRQATKDAGTIAGLRVLRIINEPTAASLAYGLDRGGSRRIAVYDLGGGTFDISILEIGEGVVQVRATSGDTFLGGDDFDRRIMDHLLAEFRQAEGIDLTADPVALQRLRDAAEDAKHLLSVEELAEVNLPFIAITATGPRHLRSVITRARFEAMVEDLVQRTLGPCRRALEDSGLTVGEVQDVVLVGGQSRMPRVRDVVQQFFGREPHTRLNPDEVVAVGAAVQAAVLKGDYDDVLLLDVTPLSLGLETKGGLFTPFIERNTTIPTRRTLIFTTTEEYQTSVNVHVLQGERPLAADNVSLAKFELLGIPPSLRGLPKIEVTFDIDANGILSVTARDLATNLFQSVRVTPSSGLAIEDIERIMRDADAARRDDEDRRRQVLVMNDVETAIYSAESLLRNHGPQLRPEQRDHCQDLIRELRMLMSQGNTGAMEPVLNELRMLSKHLVNTLM